MGFRRDVDGDYHGEDANLAVADWVVLAPKWAEVRTARKLMHQRHVTQWEALKVYGLNTDSEPRRFDTLEAALLWIHMEAANGGG